MILESIVLSSLVFLKVDDFNRAIDVVVPFYILFAFYMFIFRNTSSGSISGGNRKVYESKKKQVGNENSTIEKRNWKDAFDGTWELFDSTKRDEWLAFTGINYMKRSIAIRMVWRSEIRIKDGKYYYARDFKGSSGIVNRWTFTTPVTIGTSRETAESVEQPYDGKMPLSR